MPEQHRKWVRVGTLGLEQKAAITAACGRLIVEALKPRFLPAIRPTSLNYPIDIFGKWRGSKYSFITRYRSGSPENLGEEFDAAFTRLDYVEECLTDTRFDVCGAGTLGSGGVYIPPSHSKTRCGSLKRKSCYGHCRKGQSPTLRR